MKCKDIIQRKIPKSDTSNSNDLAEIEIAMQFLMHKIDYEIIQTQSDKRNHNE
jgi:hypothetical protein